MLIDCVWSSQTGKYLALGRSFTGKANIFYDVVNHFYVQN